MGPGSCRHSGRQRFHALVGNAGRELVILADGAFVRAGPPRPCHTGEGRYPVLSWVPAFPTEQVRGLKAHGTTNSAAQNC